MDEHTAAIDDQSHYEISLTAGQAFVAFVLLLLSLAASFAFGLMLGKGQADERLVVQKEPSIVTEATLAPKKSVGEIVDVQVEDDAFAVPGAEASTTETALAESEAADSDVADQPAEIVEAASAAPDAADSEPTKPAPVATAVSSAPANVAPAPAPATPAPAAPARAAVSAPAAAKTPHLAQLLSTGDQKVAEALAVKLIDRGFNTAYVERGTTDKGSVYRVRVRFDSEQSARAAEPKLKEFSKDVWITAR